MSVGSALSTRMFRKYRIHQVMSISAAGASASSLLTACLPAATGQCAAPLILLRCLYGLCQALVMAHAPLWARRTAPRGYTKSWLAVFQAALPLGARLLEGALTQHTPRAGGSTLFIIS